MFREKLITTLLWSAVLIAAALLGDYSINVVLLHDYAGFTPLVTLSLSTIITIPTVFAFVNGRLNLRKARDEFHSARDAAISANLTKTQFLANMSHELRTPLNAILGFSELLTLDAYAGKRAEYAALIHESGAHLLGLVNDLLDLSRIEAGRMELHWETLNLRALTDECATIVEPRAREGAVTLVRAIDPTLPLVIADRRAMKQILLNLLSNAIKFNHPGGSVELFARVEKSGELLFGVEDDGAGIADEDQARVFERFGQGRHDIHTPEKGAGLGLPIVKGLVEAHGGRVALESRYGSGTRVTVWFPAKRLEAIFIPSEHRQPSRAATG
jgi:two-component system cell cycle sensor histidine kinase PleC